jgi:hypothetical protein
MYLGITSIEMSLRGEKDMKRLAVIVTAVAFLFGTCTMGVHASVPDTGTSAQKKVMFYLKPDISVELNGERQVFKNAKGQLVYPIIYNGTTYLPVRAVSALMKEPVEWDDGSKTVYIGKTLSYPVKSEAPIPKDSAMEAGAGDISALAGLQQSLVTGYSKSDIFVMYDFEIQTFKDANGITVYPLNYDGSTYLPIRAISELMDASITWDSAAKRISISGGEEAEQDPEDQNEDEDNSEDDDAAAVTAVMEQLVSIYESEEALYYEASAKISSIRNATSVEKEAIAASASDNYLKAQTTTADIKAMDTTQYTGSEKAAYDKLQAFAESNEYYILVLENIAYMAASDQDYSALADTFLYFAMDAQAKMEDARDSVYSEPVYN